MTAIALGLVGQWCWHSPQPMQPSGWTSIRPSFRVMATSPIGQRSTQMVQSWPLSRRQRSSRHTAVPMSMSAAAVGVSAPLGQTSMQYNPSQTVHAAVSASM